VICLSGKLRDAKRHVEDALEKSQFSSTDTERSVLGKRQPVPEAPPFDPSVQTAPVRKKSNTSSKQPADKDSDQQMVEHTYEIKSKNKLLMSYWLPCGVYRARSIRCFGAMFSKIYFKKNPDCFGAGFKAYGSLRASKHVHFAVTSMKLRDFSMKTMAFEKALTIIGGNLRS